MVTVLVSPIQLKEKTCAPEVGSAHCCERTALVRESARARKMQRVMLVDFFSIVHRFICLSCLSKFIFRLTIGGRRNAEFGIFDAHRLRGAAPE
jgi:hypothetical protein